MFYDCFSEDKYEESEWLLIHSFETLVVCVIQMFSRSGSWPKDTNSLIETIVKYTRQSTSFQPWYLFPIPEGLFINLLEREADQILHWLSTSDIQKLQHGPVLNLDVFASCIESSETFRNACFRKSEVFQNTHLSSKPPKSREEFFAGLNILTGENSNHSVNPNGYWMAWARKDPMWVIELADRMKSVATHFSDIVAGYNLVAVFAMATSARSVFITTDETKENPYRRIILGESLSGLLLLPHEKPQGKDILHDDAYLLLQKHLEWWDNRESLSEMAMGQSGIQTIPSSLTLDELAENRSWERDVALFLRFGIYGIPALLIKLKKHDNGLVFTLLLRIIHDTLYSDISKEIENTILSQRIEQTRSHGGSDTPKPVPAETWLMLVSKVVMRYPDWDSRRQLIQTWWNDSRHTYANLPALQLEIDEAMLNIRGNGG